MRYPRSRLVIGLAALAGALVADQVTKWLILEMVMRPPQVIAVVPFLNLTLGFNTGVSFGLFGEFFADQPLLLAGFQALVIAGLITWAVMAERGTETVGLALMAGGALGNIVDRLRQGAVTDFLDVYYGSWHWPAFNLADVAIIAGAALLVGASFSTRKAPASSGGECHSPVRPV